MYNINPNCKELIKQGKCKADCCGCVPINAGYWQRLKKYVQNQDYEIFKFSSHGEAFINPITEDSKCVFLKSDFSCAIYNHHLKPEICSRFGTDCNEPLLACPHINEDKKDYIAKYAERTIIKLAQQGDPKAIEMMKRE